MRFFLAFLTILVPSRLLAIEDQCINLMFIITGLRLSFRQDDEQPFRLDGTTTLENLDLKKEKQLFDGTVKEQKFKFVPSPYELLSLGCLCRPCSLDYSLVSIHHLYWSAPFGFSLFTKWSRKFLLIKDTWAGCMNSPNGWLKNVILMTRNFTTSQIQNEFCLSNAFTKLSFRCKYGSRREADERLNEITNVKNSCHIITINDILTTFYIALHHLASVSSQNEAGNSS
ncbi:uncharacterized protein LOC136038683 [Artemia franciscana]|uniref:uncharacterized protein LOC136038683 n=1 Tax=Artemia franciscana TaxID=6661 RepID=UPI0032DAA779